MKDPREVVKAGDIVTVRVVEVDRERKRIALTMKSGEAKPTPPAARAHPAAKSGPPVSRPQAAPAPRPSLPPRAARTPSTALAAAFAKLSGKS